MKTTAIIIGAVMLAAAGLFVYFDDQSLLRIVCAAIFVLGAVFLYFTLARQERDEEETEPDAREQENDGEYQPFIASHEKAFSDEHRPEPPISSYVSPEEDGLKTQRAQSVAAPELPQFDDPKAEFDYLVGKLLTVIKEQMLAYTAGLFWINKDRGQIIVGEYVTDSKLFTTARRLSFANDMIGRIGEVGEPIVISEISPSSERDLIPYYDHTEGVQSFIGVPVFFDGEPVAVLCADSKGRDAFGKETLNTLEGFVAIIVQLLAGYNQKFDLTTDSKLLTTLDQFYGSVRRQFDSYGIATAAVKAASEAVDWDFITVLHYHLETRAWTVIRSATKSPQWSYVQEGMEADMNRSVLKPVIDECVPMIIDSPKPPAFRFHEREGINSHGQICAAPIATSSRWYGLLVVEYRENSQYGGRDLKALERIAEAAATTMENVRLLALGQKQLMIDEETGLASKMLLTKRLAEECERAKKAHGTFVYLAVSLDSPDDILYKHGALARDEALHKLSSAVRESLYPYDTAGRAEMNGFGCLFLETNAEEAYVRAEKMRKAFAGALLNSVDGVFSATCTVAGCVASSDMEAEQILKLARQAQERAAAEGGNCVKIV